MFVKVTVIVATVTRTIAKSDHINKINDVNKYLTRKGKGLVIKKTYFFGGSQYWELTYSYVYMHPITAESF